MIYIYEDINMKQGGAGGPNIIMGFDFEGNVGLQTLFEKIPGYRIAKISGKAGMGVFFEETLVGGTLGTFIKI